MKMKFTQRPPAAARVPIPAASAATPASVPQQATAVAVQPVSASTDTVLPAGLRIRAGSAADIAARAAAQVGAEGKAVSHAVIPSKPAAAPTGVASSAVSVSAPAPKPMLDQTTFAVHASQPEKYTEDQAAQFKELVLAMPTLFDNKDALANVLRRILKSLHDHPAFSEFLAPEDCGMMVRALRASYGTQLEIKTAKAKKSRKKEQIGSDAFTLDGIAELMVDIV